LHPGPCKLKRALSILIGFGVGGREDRLFGNIASTDLLSTWANLVPDPNASVHALTAAVRSKLLTSLNWVYAGHNWGNYRPCTSVIDVFVVLLLMANLGSLSLIFAGADGLSGHVAWIVMELSRLLFAGLLLVWIFVVGHGMPI
jgi:hypothetical protein